MFKKADRLSNAIHAATALALVCDESGWAERRQRLEYIQSRKTRLAAIAIHHAVKICPQQIRNALVCEYEGQGYEVLGIGFCSTVIKIGDKAVKLYRATENIPEDQKKKVADDLKRRQSILLEHLGDYSLVQDFRVADHPFRNGRVVTATQDAVENYSPVRMSNSDFITGLSEKRLASICNFTKDALDMVTQKGWVLDMLGADNFGFEGDDDSIRVVDTVPCEIVSNPDPSLLYLERLAATVAQKSWST